MRLHTVHIQIKQKYIAIDYERELESKLPDICSQNDIKDFEEKSK